MTHLASPWRPTCPSAWAPHSRAIPHSMAPAPVPLPLPVLQVHQAPPVRQDRATDLHLQPHRLPQGCMPRYRPRQRQGQQAVERLLASYSARLPVQEQHHQHQGQAQHLPTPTARQAGLRQRQCLCSHRPEAPPPVPSASSQRCSNGTSSACTRPSRGRRSPRPQLTLLLRVLSRRRLSCPAECRLRLLSCPRRLSRL